ncbi:OmpA family protein [Devosia beringensis]|uniref:OmpA family protein n=1 Tax=Devosia beringensis TaxID=2657486 RepID=UPI00186B99C1|nr:OmpA family protein [Devosia beringensis]
MIRDLLKWIVPGLAIVLAGSTLTLAMTSTRIAGDVASQSTAMAQRAGFDWAELSFATRDVTVSGTTTDQAYVDAAVQRLALVPGVRSIHADVTLAPSLAPFRLEAALSDGTVALSGGVPDEKTRQLLLARADLQQADLELRSGMPDRRAWIAGAQFAIDQLRYFDQGTTMLADLSVDITGRAKSERAYRDLLIVMRAGPPAGVTLGKVEIIPALISPYQWSASSDGSRIEITGYIPDHLLAERFRTAATSGLEVATGLSLGSGEPAGFAELSQTLVEQLSRLEYGKASIVDGQSTLAGAPRTLEIAQAVTEALQPAGSIVVLEPPRIDDYWVSATLQAGGKVVFDGYAPDAATRDGLQQRPGADTQYLQLGRGAPERYQSAVDFGLSALARMSEGRFALQQKQLTLSGTALSGDDYQGLLAALSSEVPQGFTLASSEILAPAATPYLWSATKPFTGPITLSGMVPQPEAKLALLGAAGPSATDALAYASGEPRNFLATAQTGIALLRWLADGQVVFDGTGWTVTGSAKSAIDKAALEADFASRQLAGSGWSMAVASPPPAVATVAVPAASVEAPYRWSATKLPNGAITLTGRVPAETLKRILADRAGDQVTDETTIDPAAPDGFTQDALAAMKALANVSDGLASFDGDRWRIDGNLVEARSADAIDTALAGAATPALDWRLTLLPPPAIAEAAPAEPAAAPLVVAPTAAPPPTPVTVDPAYAFSVRLSADGSLIFSGQVPSDAALQSLLAIADGDTAAVSIAAGAPDTFLASAEIGLAALRQLTASELNFAASAWQLTGVAPDTATRDTVTAKIAADTTATWSVKLETPAPAVAPPVAAPPVVEPSSEKVDISACAGPIADFSGRNAILFQSGAALIADESELALDELVILLNACPEAVIQVEGHTDADGDAQQNLGLSVARAEAVVNALTARGANPARLYAVGYGESQPIADNATAAGKRQNRRIVVTVSDAHF